MLQDHAKDAAYYAGLEICARHMPAFEPCCWQIDLAGKSGIEYTGADWAAEMVMNYPQIVWC